MFKKKVLKNIKGHKATWGGGGKRKHPFNGKKRFIVAMVRDS